jgi:hypothetical protein
MKQEHVISLIIGIIVLVLVTYTNLPGKYQVVAVINPETHVMQSCLLDTRTGRIRQLTYGLSKNWFWGKPEAFDMKQYDKLNY